MKTLKSVAIYSPNALLHSKPCERTAQIEHMRGFKRWAGTCFKIQSRIPSLASRSYDFIEYRLSDTATQKSLASSHGRAENCYACPRDALQSESALLQWTSHLHGLRYASRYCLYSLTPPITQPIAEYRILIHDQSGTWTDLFALLLHPIVSRSPFYPRHQEKCSRDRIRTSRKE